MASLEYRTISRDKFIFPITRWLNKPNEIFAEMIGRVKPRITPDLMAVIKGSRAVNENNGPLLFHLTRNADFEEFDINEMDFGIHAGTWKQIVAFAHTMHFITPEVEQLRVIPLVMKIERPLLCNDLGIWRITSRIYSELHRLGEISSQEYQTKIQELELLYDRDSEDVIFLAIQGCRNYLETLGFDGIGYINKGEGINAQQRSWLVWHKEQVKMLG